MSPRASSLSAVAVLLATIVVAQAASTPSLADLFHSKRFPSVSTASASTSAHEENYGYESYGVETKELCLQETEQKTCSWVSNCIDDPVVGNPFPRPQPACVYGQYWTSDFSCCTEQHYGGYDSHGSGHSGLRNSKLWAGSTSIGTCDWTILYVDADSTPNFQITTSPNPIDKLGTAWATCYLGPESEVCGGPLCDRMVMSLQGTAYWTAIAYSHFGASSTLTGNCIAVGGNPSSQCTTTGGTTTCTGNSAPGANRVVDNGKVGARRPARQPAAQPTQPRTAEVAELQNTGYGGGYGGGYNILQQVKQDVYFAEATIIMGVITSMAGQRKDKWEEGVFEYVPMFGTVAAPPQAVVTTGLDASVPWVRDKTYKLTFYRGNAHSS